MLEDEALHFSMNQLKLQLHRDAGTWSDELKERFCAPTFPRDEVMPYVNLRQLGSGNASCGTGASECYIFPDRRGEWNATLVPTKGGNAVMLRKAARKVRQVASCAAEEEGLERFRYGI